MRTIIAIIIPTIAIILCYLAFTFDPYLMQMTELQKELTELRQEITQLRSELACRDAQQQNCFYDIGDK